MEGKKSHSLIKLLRIYLLMVKKRASFQMAQLSECNGMPPLKSVSSFSKCSWFNFFFFFFLNLKHLGLGSGSVEKNTCCVVMKI